jgi:hypothetical protein
MEVLGNAEVLHSWFDSQEPASIQWFSLLVCPLGPGLGGHLLLEESSHPAHYKEVKAKLLLLDASYFCLCAGQSGPSVSRAQIGTAAIPWSPTVCSASYTGGFLPRMSILASTSVLPYQHAV